MVRRTYRCARCSAHTPHSLVRTTSDGHTSILRCQACDNVWTLTGLDWNYDLNPEAFDAELFDAFQQMITTLRHTPQHAAAQWATFAQQVQSHYSQALPPFHTAYNSSDPDPQHITDIVRKCLIALHYAKLQKQFSHIQQITTTWQQREHKPRVHPAPIVETPAAKKQRKMDESSPPSASPQATSTSTITSSPTPSSLIPRGRATVRCPSCHLVVVPSAIHVYMMPVIRHQFETNPNDNTVSRHMMGVFVKSKIDGGYRSIMIQECPSCLNHILSTNIVQASTAAEAEHQIHSSSTFHPIRLAPIQNTPTSASTSSSFSTTATASTTATTSTTTTTSSHPPPLPTVTSSLEAAQEIFDLATYYIDTDIDSAANKFRQLLEIMCATFLSTEDRKSLLGDLPGMCANLCNHLVTRVTHHVHHEENLNETSLVLGANQLITCVQTIVHGCHLGSHVMFDKNTGEMLKLTRENITALKYTVQYLISLAYQLPVLKAKLAEAATVPLLLEAASSIE